MASKRNNSKAKGKKRKQDPTDAPNIRDDAVDQNTPDGEVQAAGHDNNISNNQSAAAPTGGSAGGTQQAEPPSIHITTEVYANWGVNEIAEIVQEWVTSGDGKNHKDPNVWSRDLQEAVLALSRKTRGHVEWVKLRVGTLHGNRMRNHKGQTLGLDWAEKKGKLRLDLEKIIQEYDEEKYKTDAQVAEIRQKQEEKNAKTKKAQKGKEAAARDEDADEQPDGPAAGTRGKKGTGAKAANKQGKKKTTKGAKGGQKNKVQEQTAGAKTGGRRQATAHPHNADFPPTVPTQPDEDDFDVQGLADTSPTAPILPQEQPKPGGPSAASRPRRPSDLARANKETAMAQSKRATAEGRLKEARTNLHYHSIMGNDDEVEEARKDIAEAERDIADLDHEVGIKRWDADNIRDKLKMQGVDFDE